MWYQTSYDNSLDPSAHVSWQKVRADGTPYPEGWPVDENGNPKDWEGHVWRWRPYDEIDPSKKNAVAGFAPSRAYNVATPGIVTLSGDKANLVRSSHWMDVAAGVYDFRIRRITADASSATTASALTLLQLKYVQPDNADYTGQKRMAIRILASSQLNGSLDNVSGVAVAKCPVWTGTEWVTKFNSNPAWWFLWLARGKFDANGRRLYGGGMADSEIDIDTIVRWAAFCTANGLSVNKVLDKASTVGAQLDAIAQCGFASKGWPNGKLSVTWSVKDQPAVCLFTPDNIKTGSFAIDWIASKDLAEEIIVNYVDRSTWETAQVRQLVPGATSPRNSTTIDFDGCTSKEMAGKYANLKAASQKLHRRHISWDADIEGLQVRRGDIAQFSHDMTQWGYAGRLLGGSRNVLTLDKPVPQSAGGGWLTLRFPDQRMHTYRVQGGSGESAVLTLAGAIPDADESGMLPVPTEGGNPLDWVWLYDPISSVPGMRLLVIDVKPVDFNTAQITAVDDSPEYYDSINDAYDVLSAPVLQSKAYRVLSASAFTGSYDPVSGQYFVTCAWTLDRECPVRVDCWVNDRAASASVGVGVAGINARAGDMVKFTINPTPVALAAVYPKSAEITVTGKNIPLPDVTGLDVESAFTGTDCAVKWVAVENATGYIGEVWAGGVLRRSVDLGNVLRYAYVLDESKADGGPYRTVTIKIKAVGEAGQSVNWAAITASNPAPAMPTGVRAKVGFGSIMMSWDAPVDLDVAGYTVHMSTVPGFAPGTANRVSDDTALSAIITRTANAGVLEVGTTYYLRVAAYDLFGRDTLNYCGELAVTMTAIPAALIELQNLGPANFDPATAEAVANMQALSNADLDALAQIDTELLASMSSELQAARDAVQQQAIAQLNALVAQDVEAGKRRAASAAIVRETQTRISELQAVAEDILALVARVGEAEAGITSANQVRASEDAALSEWIVELDAEITTQAGQTLAAANSHTDTAVAGVNQSISQARTDLTASIGTAKGEAITAANSHTDTAVAGVNQSISQARTDLTASIGTAKGEAITAANSHTDEVVLTESSALSQQIGLVTTTVDGHTTSIGELTESVDGMLGQWSVSIVQDANGVKKVSGIRLLSDGTSSAFDILADVFRVSLPDGTGSKQAFTLGMLGGVPALGLSGDMYMDGTLHGRAIITQTVTAEKIDVTNLSAISGDIGLITSGFLRNASGNNFLNLNASGTADFIVAGDDVLIRADGYAEFNNVKARGDIHATSLNADIVTTEKIVSDAVTEHYSATGNSSCSVSVNLSVPGTATVMWGLSTVGYTASGSLLVDGVTLDTVYEYSAGGYAFRRTGFVVVALAVGSHSISVTAGAGARLAVTISKR